MNIIELVKKFVSNTQVKLTEEERRQFREEQQYSGWIGNLPPVRRAFVAI